MPQILLDLDTKREPTFNATASNLTDVNASPYDNNDDWKERVVSENSRVGWLLSSKAVTQLMFNCFMSSIVLRY